MDVLEKKEIIACDFRAFIKKFAHEYLLWAQMPPPSAGCADGGRP